MHARGVEGLTGAEHFRHVLQFMSQRGYTLCGTQIPSQLNAQYRQVARSDHPMKQHSIQSTWHRDGRVDIHGPWQSFDFVDQCLEGCRLTVAFGDPGTNHRLACSDVFERCCR